MSTDDADGSASRGGADDEDDADDAGASTGSAAGTAVPLRNAVAALRAMLAAETGKDDG